MPGSDIYAPESESPPPSVNRRSGGRIPSIYEVPDSFAWPGRGAGWWAIPRAVVLMLALYAVAHVLMSRMALGRYIYAVGGNVEAAGSSGIAAGLLDMIKKHGWRDVLRSLRSWRTE